MTPLQQHIDKWSDCKLCTLCERRRNVVLGRGTVPCDVLFVGEAPGETEDDLAKSFSGPAGHQLDGIIAKASQGMTIRCAFCNIVCCIPKDEDGHKLSEPSDKEIRACQPRLQEFVRQVAQPRLIVCVGKLAQTWVPKAFMPDEFMTVGIIHPSAILQSPAVSRGLLQKRAIVVLANALANI